MKLTRKFRGSPPPKVPVAVQSKQSDARQANRAGLTTCLPFAIVRDGVIGTLTTVLARDVSQKGISFLSSTELCQGQEFIVWLMTPNGCVAVHSQVVWREALSRTSFLVGGVYTRLGTKEEVALITASDANTASPATGGC
jgi:hypothetical protein